MIARRCSCLALRGGAIRRPSLRAFASLQSSVKVPLPVVDISPFMNHTVSCAESRQRTAKELDAACRGVGFFYLVGHGVPEAERCRLHSLAQDFFSLPTAKKEEIALSRQPQTGRGYQRIGENVTLGVSDWHEAIDLYAEFDSARGNKSINLDALLQSPAKATAADVETMRPWVFGKNLWPDEPADLKTVAQSHIQHCSNVGRALMEAMTLAFGLPEGYFRTLTDNTFWCMRIIGYPPSPRKDEANAGIGCGEHTDYGCWTILSQDDTPDALEVRRSDGSWIPAEPLPGAFVVNLGDMLSVWTKRQYAATPHRVRRPQSNFRTSVGFFFEPNYDAVISPLSTFAICDAGDAWDERSTEPLRRAARGEDLVYGEHVYSKVRSNFQFDEAASVR